MKTALYPIHESLGAKIVSFAGWDMPLNYQGGILAEHKCVREKVGLFDVSHMGRIDIKGPDASKCLDFLSANRIEGRPTGSATYTVWCSKEGTCIDDVIIFKVDDTHFFVVCNASNRQKDLEHLIAYVKRNNYDVVVQDRFSDSSILALQGPKALSIMSSIYPDVLNLKPMHFLLLKHHDQLVYISRTGYTGAGGFEIYTSSECGKNFWQQLMTAGSKEGIMPIGLGARDTLRLEAGFALYGHELTDSIAASESVSAWSIKMDKPLFLGKDALEKIELSPLKRRAYGIQLNERAIARQNDTVWQKGKKIGVVTSGGFSPTLGQPIAIILVEGHLQYDDQIEIEIRNKLYPAKICRLPFVRKMI